MLDVEKSGWKVSECRYCGEPVVWAKRFDKEGNIPLDPVAPVFSAALYSYGRQIAEQEHEEPFGDVKKRVFVSHFSTCRTLQRAYKTIQSLKNLVGSAEALSELSVKRQDGIVALIKGEA